MSDAAHEGESSPEKPAKAAGPPMIVALGALLGGLVVGGVAGAFVVAPRVIAAKFAAPGGDGHGEPHGKSGKKKAKKEGHGKEGHGGAEKASVYKVDNVIVNPAGSAGQHFLMASIAIQVDDEELQKGLHDQEVPLRDAVIATLESKTLEELTSPGIRDSLRVRLADVVRPFLGEDGEEAEIRVFLPQFVIQ